MPRLFKHLLFSLIAILFLLAGAEGVLRLLNIKARVDNPFFMLVRVFEYPDFFEKDQELFWRLRKNISDKEEFLVPGSYRTNALGFRGGELPAETPSTFTVACFGNSCTFGWRLAEDRTYPGQLQTRLAPISRAQFRVVNCGVPGYSSFQGLRLLRETLPRLKPKVVTICYGWNDHWAAGFDIEDKAQEMAPQWILDAQNVLSRSYVYRAVKYALLSRSEKAREYTYNKQSPKYRVGLEDYRANLEAMIRLCREQGATPILITAPVGDADPGQVNPMEAYHERYSDVVRQTAADLGVGLVDAARLFAEHPEYFDDPKGDFIHYNERGAAAISAELERLILSLP